MDSKLFDYFLVLGFEEDDISLIIQNAPQLKNTSYKQAMQNINLVVEKGFPVEDIDGLIFANPNFLVQPPEFLQEALNNIDGDIETALKTDPFLI